MIWDSGKDLLDIIVLHVSRIHFIHAKFLRCAQIHSVYSIRNGDYMYLSIVCVSVSGTSRIDCIIKYKMKIKENAITIIWFDLIW